jgi:hypothetical protein
MQPTTHGRSAASLRCVTIRRLSGRGVAIGEAPPDRGRFEGCESACKPDPVVDGHLSGTDIAAGLARSTRDVAGGPPCPCSTLLRMGFAEPPRSPGSLVVSYTTVSPLPVPGDVRFPRPSAVCSLLHFPSGRPAWELPSILPCGVRTFLDPKAAAVSRTRTENASAKRRVPAPRRRRGRAPRTPRGALSCCVLLLR